jgi:hypothetical protein
LSLTTVLFLPPQVCPPLARLLVLLDILIAVEL